MNYRTQIRKNIVQRLSALAVPGVTIQEDQFRPATTANLPLVIVSTGKQSGQSKDAPTPTFQTNLEVEIKCAVKASNDCLDAVELLSDQVVSGLFCDNSFLEQFEDISQFSLDVGFNDKGETHVAIALITFTVVFSDQYQPILEDEFLTIGLNVDVEPADTILEAQLIFNSRNG